MFTTCHLLFWCSPARCSLPAPYSPGVLHLTPVLLVFCLIFSTCHLLSWCSPPDTCSGVLPDILHLTPVVLMFSTCPLLSWCSPPASGEVQHEVALWFLTFHSPHCIRNSNGPSVLLLLGAHAGPTLSSEPRERHRHQGVPQKLSAFEAGTFEIL